MSAPLCSRHDDCMDLIETVLGAVLSALIGAVLGVTYERRGNSVRNKLKRSEVDTLTVSGRDSVQIHNHPPTITLTTPQAPAPSREGRPYLVLVAKAIDGGLWVMVRNTGDATARRVAWTALDAVGDEQVSAPIASDLPPGSEMTTVRITAGLADLDVSYSGVNDDGQAEPTLFRWPVGGLVVEP